MLSIEPLKLGSPLALVERAATSLQGPIPLVALYPERYHHNDFDQPSQSSTPRQSRFRTKRKGSPVLSIRKAKILAQSNEAPRGKRGKGNVPQSPEEPVTQSGISGTLSGPFQSTRSGGVLPPATRTLRPRKKRKITESG